MKIAIVGAGVAGSSVLRTLIEGSPQAMIEAIDVFDYREELSRGLPYQADDSALLMNSRPDEISVYPQEPEDFVDWLKANGLEDETRQGMVQRWHYGRYLNQRFAQYFQDRRVTVYSDEIQDLLVYDDQGQPAYQDIHGPASYRLQKASGEWLGPYDSVFFAIGHPPYADYYQLEGHAPFVRDPYPVHENLAFIQDQQKVGIIGSGSTSFDILRYLQDYHKTVDPIPLYIRTTPFTPTKVRLEEDPKIPSIDAAWIEAHRHPETGQIPLQDIFDQVLEDFDRYGADWGQTLEQYAIGDLSENIRQYHDQPRSLGVIQEYISNLTAYLPDLYNALSQADREAYDHDYRPAVEHFRHVVPYETMGAILNGLKNNKLRLVSGLTDIKWREEAEAFDIYIDGSLHESCDVLINGTGFDLRLKEAAAFQPLIKNLYNKRYIMPASQKTGEGVAVTWPEAQVLNQRMGKLPFVYFMGHYIHLTQYGNNNAQLNMKQGRRSADHLIACYKDKQSSFT